MLTVVAKIKVKADQAAKFEEEARKLIAHVQANEPGTRTYVLHRSTADPTVYLFYEVYEDQAAFAAHGGSPAMQAFFGAMRGVVDGRPELEMYDMAALDVIVREAGGLFTSLDGEPGPTGGNVLASNGKLHDQALAFLGSVDEASRHAQRGGTVGGQVHDLAERRRLLEDGRPAD